MVAYREIQTLADGSSTARLSTVMYEKSPDGRLPWRAERQCGVDFVGCRTGCLRQENGSVYAPINAVSHWLWGDSEAHQ